MVLDAIKALDSETYMGSEEGWPPEGCPRTLLPGPFVQSWDPPFSILGTFTQPLRKAPAGKRREALLLTSAQHPPHIQVTAPGARWGLSPGGGKQGAWADHRETPDASWLPVPAGARVPPARGIGPWAWLRWRREDSFHHRVRPTVPHYHTDVCHGGLAGKISDHPQGILWSLCAQGRAGGCWGALWPMPQGSPGKRSIGGLAIVNDPQKENRGRRKEDGALTISP